MQRSMLILGFLSLLISCGSSDKGEPYEQGSLDAPSDSEFKKLINSAEVSYDTPEGLGLLINRNMSDQVGTCTWFSVGEDIMATNSHCIPEEIKSNPHLKCKNYIGGVVKGSEDVHLYCKEVISYTDISKKDFTQTDLAFIRVHKVANTQKYQLTQDGFKDLQNTIIHKIDTSSYETYDSNGDWQTVLYGNYNRKRCKTSMNSIFGNFNNWSSSIIPIYQMERYAYGEDNCHVIGGNSGSPVSIEGENEYNTPGIVFAGKNESAKLLLKNINSSAQTSDKSSNFDISKDSNALSVFNKIRDSLVKDIDRIGYFGLISNFSCLSFPEGVEAVFTDGKNTSECSVASQSSDSYEQAFIDQINNQLDQEAESLIDSLDNQYFRYVIDQGEHGILSFNKKTAIYPKPICFNPSIYSFFETNIALRKTIPYYSVDRIATLGEFGKIEVKIETENHSASMNAFKEDESTIEYSVSSYYLDDGVIGYTNIPSCSSLDAPKTTADNSSDNNEQNTEAASSDNDSQNEESLETTML